MSKIHLEILDTQRQRVFNALSRFKKYGYLAGGTGLSLQIAHRRSYDFDIFTAKPISTSLRAMVKEVFGEVAYYVNSTDQISFSTKEKVNITFVWYYYRSLYSLVPTHSLMIAEVKDIAADKAHTMGRRAAWRDYVDIFFLLEKDLVTLEDIIGFAKNKFGGEFNEILFLEQLSYFRDLEITPIEFVSDSYSESEIKSFLEVAVGEYTKKTLK